MATVDKSWVRDFYTKQEEWAGVSRGPVTDAHRRNAALVHRLTAGRVGKVLDSGTGGGLNAAAPEWP